MAHNFKVGDKVRLTGSAWGETLDHKQGDIVEVIRLDYSGRPLLKGGWFANEGGRWSTELVQETDPAVTWVEQDDWSKVKRGDKVRLTNGDNVYEGTVNFNYEDDNIDVRNGKSQLDTYKSDGWKLEVEKPVEPTLEPGFYTSKDHASLIFRVDGEGKVHYTHYEHGMWTKDLYPLTTLVKVDARA